MTRQLDDVAQLASQVRFLKVGSTLYAQVPSLSHPGTVYTLPVDRERWLAVGLCQCRGAKYRRDCRHKMAVDLRLSKQRDAAFRYHMQEAVYKEAQKDL